MIFILLLMKYLIYLMIYIFAALMYITFFLTDINY